MAKIAVLGYGTVGSGVVEVLNTNGASIAKRAGDTIEVKSVLDLRDFPGDPIQDKIVHDIDLIINDPEIEVVVEVMGGVEPAFTFVKKALEAGKSVCTSNKALVAAHGPELLEMAKERRLNFMFEASVGGGIPIIRPLNQSLTADEITKITGILNGTTNYILTKMSREGISYQEVLKEAQALGYAEKNPEADVEGYDACRKIAILTSLAFGNTVKFEEVYTEGITKISNEDFAYAKELGSVIKLLATSYSKDGKVYAITAPFMIDSTHPLYNVNDQNQNIVRSQFQFSSARFSFSRFEVKAWRFHLLALHHGIELRGQQVNVHGIDMFKVVFPVFVARRMFAVHEVIVRRNRHRFQSASNQLHAQAFRKRRLTARRRSRNQNHLIVRVSRDAVSQSRNFLLLQRLAHVHQLVREAQVARMVKLSNRRNPQNFVPAVLLAKHLKHLRLINHRLQFIRIFRVRNAQQQSVAVAHQVKQVKLRRLNQQRTIEVVRHVVERVVRGVKRAQTLKQLRLTFQAVGTEARNSLLRRASDAVKRQVCLHDFLHTRFQTLHHIGRHAPFNVEVTVVTVRHRRIDAQRRSAAIQIVHRLVQHKEQRARVRAQSRRRSNVKKLHIFVVEKHEVQSLHLIVHLSTRCAMRHIKVQHFVHLFEGETDGHAV